MKKKYFINLIISVLAGLLFSVGLCMCLLSEWHLLTVGIVLASIGGVVLIIMGIIALVKNPKKTINWKLIGKITYVVVATLILGFGMAMIMVWNIILWGILVGIIGLLMLLFLIPMFFGLQK